MTSWWGSYYWVLISLRNSKFYFVLHLLYIEKKKKKREKRSSRKNRKECSFFVFYSIVGISFKRKMKIRDESFEERGNDMIHHGSYSSAWSQWRLKGAWMTKRRICVNHEDKKKLISWRLPNLGPITKKHFASHPFDSQTWALLSISSILLS